MPPYQGQARRSARRCSAYLISARLEGQAPRAGDRDLTMAAPSAAEIAAVLQPARGEWPSYNGTPTSNRPQPDRPDQHRPMSARLKLALWSFGAGRGTGLETTPVVMDGVMYVDRRQADLRARRDSTGRSFWCARATRDRQAAARKRHRRAPQQRAPATTKPSAAIGPAIRRAAPRPAWRSGNGPNRGVAVVRQPGDLHLRTMAI